MRTPTTADPSPTPRAETAGPDDAAVERALAVLQARPYGADASPEQERACRLIYRTLLGRLSAVCRRVGLDDEEVANVLHPKLHQFFTRDVGRIGPTRADLERWMTTVCANAARSALAARIRHSARDRAAAPLLALEAEEEESASAELDVADVGDVGDVGDERGAAAPDPTVPDLTAEEEPRWLDAPFPARIDRQRFVAAVAALTDRQRLLLHTAFRHVRDRDGHRLPATEIARELGLTPASVSVRWSELLAKLRRACAPPPPPDAPTQAGPRAGRDAPAHG